MSKALSRTIACAVVALAVPASAGAVSCAERCEGARPGAVMVNSDPPVLDGVLPDGHCTVGFLFRAGGVRYASTTGHCAVTEGSEERWGPGEGPEVHDTRGRRLGRFVYAVANGTPGVYLDFGLVALDPGVKADPEVCRFGGPTGLNEDVIAAPDPIELRYFGAGIVGGYMAGRWVAPARSGVALGMPSERRVMFNGHATFGDSGAPLLTRDGRAVGLISGPGDAADRPGAVYAPRLRPQLRAAEAALGMPLALWTAPARKAA